MNRKFLFLFPLLLAASLLILWLSPARAALPATKYIHSSISIEPSHTIHSLSGTSIASPQGAPVSAVPHPILGDVRVRQAIAYCTDKDALLAAAYPGLTPAERAELLMDTFIPPDNWAYTSPNVTYPYNPTLGMGLLDDAGWVEVEDEAYRMKDGRELALVLKTSDTSARVALAAEFTDQMATCGIHFIPRNLPMNYIFGATTGMARRDFSVLELGWVLVDDDPGGYNLYACDAIPTPANGWPADYQNYTGWCNTEATAALATATDTSLTQNERKTAYAEFNDLMLADMPSLPLFVRPGTNDAWEHIDFNLETFSSWKTIISDTTNVVDYVDFSGNHGWIVVPPGALVTPTEVNDLFYSPLEDPGAAIPEGQTELLSFRLSMYTRGVPQDTYEFNTPITLTVPYTMNDLRPVYEDSLSLYYWDGETWQPAVESCPSAERYELLDTEDGLYFVRICHFSEFALIGDSHYWRYIPLVRH